MAEKKKLHFDKVKVAQKREHDGYRNRLYQVLREDALLSSEKANELADKYGKLADFAKAVRDGEKIEGIDDVSRAKIRLIGLTW
jgi:hypothetical protein